MGERPTAERVVFDLPGLHAALEAERRARGLSQPQAAREIGVAPATLLRTARGGAMEADGVLAMVRWLGAAPERFVLPPPAAPGGGVPQGRCDTRELHRRLDRRRRDRGLTWRQVADELGDFVAPPMLTRLAGGGRIDIRVLAAAAAWLEAPIASLARAAARGRGVRVGAAAPTSLAKGAAAAPAAGRPA